MRHLPFLFLIIAATSIRAVDPPPDYKSAYRVINVHRHGMPVEAAMCAEFEVDDRVGISTVVILDGGSPAGTLPAWIELKKKFPDRLIVFYKLNFTDVAKETFFTDIVQDLDRAAKQGVQGVKVWKDLGMYIRDGSGKVLKADDQRLDPFWDKCAELGLPVLWHIADSREYWYPLTYNSYHYGLRKEKDQHYHEPAMPGWEELIRQRDAVLKKHPKTVVIGAHMGCMEVDLDSLGQTLDRFPNFNVDTAARMRILGRLNPPAMRDFFVKYQDRILFGTDDMVMSKGRKPSNTGNIYIYPGDDPNMMWIDPADHKAVKIWQDRAAFDYGQYFQYFETDIPGLADPNRSGGPWLRFPGIKLPPEVLEKVYHANAERLIPGMKSATSKP